MLPLWNNRDLLVYDGADSGSFAALSSSIELNLCRPNTDFGQGFYTTTRLHQAERWANTRGRRAPKTSGVHAIVLSFRLSRQWLASLLLKDLR